MKLSDVKGDRALDVIADLLDPIYNIAADDKAAALFRKRKLPDGMTSKEFGMEWLKDAAPKLLKAHKMDCIAILSIIAGQTAEEYIESLNLTKLLSDVADLISDETFAALFFSTTQSTEDSSGSALESTEAQEV